MSEREEEYPGIPIRICVNKLPDQITITEKDAEEEEEGEEEKAVIILIVLPNLLPY